MAPSALGEQKFYYDAKTSTFRRAAAAGKGAKDRSPAPCASAGQRQLRRPDQLLYSAKASCFYLREDGPPGEGDRVAALPAAPHEVGRPLRC